MDKDNNKYVITHSEGLLKNPSGAKSDLDIRYLTYENALDKAVERFSERILSLDAGCVQIWERTEDNNYVELGYLYL